MPLQYNSIDSSVLLVVMVAQVLLQSILPMAGTRILRWREKRPAGRGEIRTAQQQQLHNLSERLAHTKIGEATGIHVSMNCETFRKHVPISNYASIAAFVDRAAQGEPDIFFPGKVRALAQTSGTTSDGGPAEKFIPQGTDLLRHHQRGAEAALCRLLERDQSVLAGRMLMLGGSTGLPTNAYGIPTGDLSGITASLVPEYLSGLVEPPTSIALESNWNRKLERLVEHLAHADLRLISGVPAWCQLLFEAVCRYRGVSSVAEVWPNLRAFVHGGASITPLLPLLRQQLPAHCLLQETYPSSEAFVAVGTRPWHLYEDTSPDLELLTAHGTYLEFLPHREGVTGAEAVGAWELESGQVYRLLVTTPGGLIRYEIGDLVEGRGAGFIRFAGRTRTRLSLFGEHVEGAALAQALAEACRKETAVVREYHVAPVMPTSSDARGGHEWFVEFQTAPQNLERFAHCLDTYLRKEVMDYDAHRAGEVQLRAPIVTPILLGGFVQVLAKRGKLGGQHKVPQAWNDRSWAADLETLQTEVRQGNSL